MIEIEYAETSTGAVLTLGSPMIPGFMYMLSFGGAFSLTEFQLKASGAVC